LWSWGNLTKLKKEKEKKEKEKKRKRKKKGKKKEKKKNKFDIDGVRSGTKKPPLGGKRWKRQCTRRLTQLVSI
jgi:hypothetical protein